MMKILLVEQMYEKDIKENFIMKNGVQKTNI